MGVIWLDERPMFQPLARKIAPQICGAIEHVAAAVWFVADDVERCNCGGGGGGGKSGGEDVGAGAVHEPVDQAAAASDETAGAAEGFTQSAHTDVDAGFDAEMFGDSAAVCAEDAGGVGFVDHQHGGMFFGEFRDFIQWGYVAVHAEQ